MQIDLQFREFTFAKMFGNEISTLATGTNIAMNGLVDQMTITNAAAGKF